MPAYACQQRGEHDRDRQHRSRRRARPVRPQAGTADRRGGRAQPAAASGRPAPARACWRKGCRDCCRRSKATRRWTWPPLRRPAVAASSRANTDGARFARRTTPRPPEPSLAEVRMHGRARSVSRIVACCSSTNCRSSTGECSSRCASRWRSGVVAISRAAMQVEYPARFQLVAAMNPCPCGFLGDASGRCRCAPPEIARYRARISGPLLDRIDLRVEVPAVPDEELLDGASRRKRSPARSAGEQVRAARQRQLERAGKLNADLAGDELKDFCALDRRCRLLIAQARARFELSARAVHRAAARGADHCRSGKRNGPHESFTGARSYRRSPAAAARRLKTVTGSAR